MSNARADANPASGNSRTPSTTSSRLEKSSQQHPEISRWSSSTSSVAGRGSRNLSQQSTGSGNDSTAANHGSVASTTSGSPTNTADSIEAARRRAALALEHGERAPESDRCGESLASRVTEAPREARQMSSSGASAQMRRLQNKRT